MAQTMDKVAVAAQKAKQEQMRKSKKQRELEATALYQFNQKIAKHASDRHKRRATFKKLVVERRQSVLSKKDTDAVDQM